MRNRTAPQRTQRMHGTNRNIVKQAKPHGLILLGMVPGRAAQMDASAILDYFAPLKSWLDEQNEGRQCGF